MLKTFPKTFCYAWRKQWWLILLVVAALLWCVHVFLCCKPINTNGMVWWNDYWNAVAGVLTLLVAVMLWWNDMEQQRRADLPKRLDVEFREDNHAGRVVLRCDNAIISAAGDERAFAQQIGAQMCGGSRDLLMDVAGVYFKYCGLQGEGKNEHHHYLIRIPLLLAMQEKELPLKKKQEKEQDLKQVKDADGVCHAVCHVQEKQEKKPDLKQYLGQHWVVDAQGGIDKSKRLF